jgi:eukaryotic-like serine/threonine-protein kinase
MKLNKNLLIISLLLFSILLSACSSNVYASTGWHGLTSNTDTAFLAAGTQVYAVDLKTGTEKWRYPEKVNAKISFYANPVLTADGQLLVPSYDHNLYSLDAATGAEKWVFSGSKNRLIGSPLVAQNMIYQPSHDSYIYAINMSGNPVWKYETSGPVWAQPATKPDCGCIYVASMDHKVYALNATSGSLIWKSVDLEGAIVGAPTVSGDGLIYVGTFAKEMIALDATSGDVRWRFDTQDWVWSGSVIANDTLYFGDISGYLYAVNASDGTSLWRIQPDKTIVSTPALSGDSIYLTSEADTLYIASLSGTITSSKVIGGLIYASPVIANDTILVAPTNYDALLVAMNPDGNPKWTFIPAKK